MSTRQNCALRFAATTAVLWVLFLGSFADVHVANQKFYVDGYVKKLFCKLIPRTVVVKT